MGIEDTLQRCAITTRLVMHNVAIAPNLIERVIAALPGTSIETLDVIDAQHGDVYLRALEGVLSRSNLRAIGLVMGNMSARAICRFIDVVSTSKVSYLALAGEQVVDDVLCALASALPRSSLNCLAIDIRRCSSRSVVAVLKALPRSKLTNFKLQNGAIGLRLCHLLARVLPLTEVHTLGLVNACLSGPGVSKLAQAIPSSSITSLFLRKNCFGDAGASALAPAISRLHLLDVRQCQLGLSGLQVLTDSLHESNLHTLRIDAPQASEISCMLSRSLRSAALQILYLDSLPISNEGILGLQTSRIAALTLNKVVLGGISEESWCRGLSGSALRSLELYNCQVEAECLRAIAQGIRGSNVTHLTIVGCLIGDAGIGDLCAALLDSEVTYLDVSQNVFGLDAMRIFAEMLPHTKLTQLKLERNRNINLHHPSVLAFLNVLGKTRLEYLSPFIELAGVSRILRRNAKKNQLTGGLLAVAGAIANSRLGLNSSLARLQNMDIIRMVPRFL